MRAFLSDKVALSIVRQIGIDTDLVDVSGLPLDFEPGEIACLTVKVFIDEAILESILAALSEQYQIFVGDSSS